MIHIPHQVIADLEDSISGMDRKNSEKNTTGIKLKPKRRPDAWPKNVNMLRKKRKESEADM